MQLIKDTHIDFLGKRYIALVVSTVLIAAGIFSLVTKGGPNYGIDFAGGTEVRVRFATEQNIGDLRNTLSGMGLGEVVIQSFITGEGIFETLIRVEKIEESAGEAAGEGGHIADAIIGALRSEDEQRLLDQGLVDLNQSGRDTVSTLLLAAFAGDEEQPAPSQVPENSEEPAPAGDADAATEADADGLMYTADDLAMEESDSTLVTGSKSARDIAAAVIDHRDHTGGLLKSFDDLRVIPEMSDRAMQALSERAFFSSFAVVGVDFVGPTVGYDLRGKAIQAIVWCLIGILAYITLRFKFHWGIGAVAALFHDVMVTVGIFSLFNREFNLTVIAGLMTIVGYSLNDTIVVFDRIRDNLKSMRRSAFPDIVNASINQTLSRTLLTSLTTMLVVLCLLILGGQVINNFAFALMIGVITGTYSSIFVASPILAYWQKVIDNRARPGK